LSFAQIDKRTKRVAKANLPLTSSWLRLDHTIRLKAQR